MWWGETNPARQQNQLKQKASKSNKVNDNQEMPVCNLTVSSCNQSDQLSPDISEILKGNMSLFGFFKYLYWSWNYQWFFENNWELLNYTTELKKCPFFPLASVLEHLYHERVIFIPDMILASANILPGNSQTQTKCQELPGSILQNSLEADILLWNVKSIQEHRCRYSSWPQCLSNRGKALGSTRTVY